MGRGRHACARTAPFVRLGWEHLLATGYVVRIWYVTASTVRIHPFSWSVFGPARPELRDSCSDAATLESAYSSRGVSECQATSALCPGLAREAERFAFVAPDLAGNRLAVRRRPYRSLADIEPTGMHQAPRALTEPSF